jgi:aspartate 1-decarboxylase
MFDNVLVARLCTTALETRESFSLDKLILRYAMLINLLQAKLHRVCVTRADLHYEGSCGIDEDLLDASGISEFQHLEIYNVENGERLTTYAIKSSRGSGEICLNGAAARKAAVGDHLIICAYSTYSEAELSKYRPVVVLVDASNRPKNNSHYPRLRSSGGLSHKVGDDVLASAE